MLLIVILLAFMVTTVDDTPYKKMAYYQQWKKSVGSGRRSALQLANAQSIGNQSAIANRKLVLSMSVGQR